MARTAENHAEQIEALKGLLERVKTSGKPDWKLDEDILKGLGWQIRRVSRLGLSGRSRGSERAWPPGSKARLGYLPPKPTSSRYDALSLVRRHTPEAPTDEREPLAICAALLSAKLALLTQEESDA